MKYNVDTFNEVQNDLIVDVDYFISVTDKVVKEYTGELDRLMERVKSDIIVIDNPSLDTLEKYFLELTNALYFISTSSEKLAIFDALSKTNAMEKYNTTYLNHQNSNVGNVGAKKPTVAESTAVSENAAIYEQTTNDIYNKAYKMVKAKIDSANIMVSTISKIISKRMQEMNLSNNPTGRQLLVESI